MALASPTNTAKLIVTTTVMGQLAAISHRNTNLLEVNLLS